MARWAILAAVTMAGPVGAADAQSTADEMLADARAWTAAADAECESSGREIVVCARNNDNDRYRLPFVAGEPGDPRHEGVMAERVRLQANPGTCQGWASNRTGCGFVGVHAGIGAGGVRVGGARRRAY